MNPRIKLLVRKLNLRPHPEGGYYSETYRSNETLKKDHLPARYNGSRHISTSIYFLVLKSNFSAFHRIKSDETWHFYEGGKLNIYYFDEKGKLQTVTLGNDVSNGEVFQYTVERNCWLAANVVSGEYSLVGCTVAPGFEFLDFELASKEELSKRFEEHRELIDKFTRN